MQRRPGVTGRRSLSASIGAAIAWLAAGPCPAQASIWEGGQRFEAHAVPAWHGARRPPNFAGAGRQFRFMRTRLRAGFASDPLYAGHWVIVQAGCGAGCVSVWIGDVTTGRIIRFPLGGEDNYTLQLHYRPTSRLVKARWSTSAGDDARCAGADLIWNGRAFTQTPLPLLPGACPWGE